MKNKIYSSINQAKQALPLHRENKYVVAVPAEAGIARLSCVISIFAMTFLLISGIICFAEPKEPFVYNSYDKRDPFIPLVTEKSKGIINTREVLGTKISLQAILRSEGKSFVIINNSVLSVGQKVPGTKIKITKILDDRVIFFYKFNEYELRLKKKLLFKPIIRGEK